MARLEVTNLMQQYRYGTTGINDLSFAVEDGCFAVLGGEESGKTSLFKVLAGKEPPYRGEVLYDGKKISAIPLTDRRIIYVRERGGIFKLRSVKYNLTYPLTLRKLPEAQIETSAAYTLDAVGLSYAEKKRAGALSAMERAKLKLARCFLRDADYYLIDEVLKWLTEEDRNGILNDVYPKIRALPGVKIFASDRYREAIALSDRGAALYYGVTEQTGDFTEFYKNPTTPEVLRLTHGDYRIEAGRLNLSAGEIVTETKKIVLEAERLRADFDLDVVVATASDGYVKIYRASDEKLIYFD